MDISILLNPTLKCRKCPITFSRTCTMLRHERNVHSKPFKCTYCRKSLKASGRPDAYRAHLKRCSLFVKKNIHLSNEEILDAIDSLTSKLSKRGLI